MVQHPGQVSGAFRACPHASPKNVSTEGLESSPVAEALAGLRADEVPEEVASRFKFARQKSRLAGVIRGSSFVIKGEY